MGYDEHEIIMKYIPFTIVLTFVALIICIILGFITYNFFSFGKPIEESLAIYALGLLIVLFPKSLTNNILSFIFSLVLGYGYFYLYINIMPLLFGAKFVPFGELHGLFGINCNTFILYMLAIVVFIIVYSIWNFNSYKDYMEKDI